MDDPSFRVQAGDVDGLPGITGLLEAVGLPTHGIAGNETTILLTARRADLLVGAAAVERYDPDGLLRSVVVTPVDQGRGIGGELVGAAETAARAAGLGALYLLTEDAVGFFERLGYRPLERNAVPAEIQGSDEYALVCPKSATVMVKRLAG